MPFNKGTIFPDIDVKSIYLHDTKRELPDKVMEGPGWVLQRVLSRASFRRPPLSGHKKFTVLSLHKAISRPKKKDFETAHYHNPCCYAWSTKWPGCNRFERDSRAVQQYEQHQYH